jgi:hypothetical protein
MSVSVFMRRSADSGGRCSATSRHRARSNRRSITTGLVKSTTRNFDRSGPKASAAGRPSSPRIDRSLCPQIPRGTDHFHSRRQRHSSEEPIYRRGRQWRLLKDPCPSRSHLHQTRPETCRLYSSSEETLHPVLIGLLPSSVDMRRILWVNVHAQKEPTSHK